MFILRINLDQGPSAAPDTQLETALTCGQSVLPLNHNQGTFGLGYEGG